MRRLCEKIPFCKSGNDSSLRRFLEILEFSFCIGGAFVIRPMVAWTVKTEIFFCSGPVTDLKM